MIDAAERLGFSRLTMTTLAETLGVRHSTLYRYVSGRQEIVEELIDRAFSGTAWPAPTDDWREYVRAYATTFADLYRSHPGMVVESGYIHRKTDQLLRALNEFRAALLDFGFAPEDAVVFSEMLTQLIRSSQDYRRTADGGSLSEDEVRAEMRTRPDDVARGADPRIRDALVAFNTDTSGRNFVTKLERLMRAFEPQSSGDSR